MVHPNSHRHLLKVICIFRACRSCFEEFHWCEISCHRNKKKKKNLPEHLLENAALPLQSFWMCDTADKFLMSGETVQSNEHWQSQPLFWLHCVSSDILSDLQFADIILHLFYKCFGFFLFVSWWCFPCLNVWSVKIISSVTYKHFIIAYNLCNSCRGLMCEVCTMNSNMYQPQYGNVLSYVFFFLIAANLLWHMKMFVASYQ